MLTPDVEKSAIPAKLVNNVLALNLRESARGGYFGNTPYWKLQRNPSWRSIERNFTSVQVYWFSLILSDITSVDLGNSIASTAISSGMLDETNDRKSLESRILSNEISQVAEYLSLGSLQIASMKHINTPRGKSLLEITSAIAPDAAHMVRKLFDGGTMEAMKNLQSFVNEDHILLQLPNGMFSPNIEIFAHVMKLAALVTLINNMLKLPSNAEIITNSRQIVPHLLHASM